MARLRKTRGFGSLFTLVAMAVACHGGQSVYSSVSEVFSRLPERRVGSGNWETAVQTVENALRGAGLDPHRQTFDSLAQQTDAIALEFDGCPVYGALMIDNGPAALVLDPPIEGPAFFLGDGSLERLDGKDIAGAVAVIDATAPGAIVEEAFVHGAAAAILVGDESLDQWTVDDVAFTALTAIPRIYLSRESALKCGLLDADGSKTVRISGRTALRDVRGCNLWTELPCTGGWTNGLSAEEAIIISATLDTYGLTPDYSPDRRTAANAALLAEVATELARRGPFPRHVFVVFFGSRYGGQEGARFFYHSVDMVGERSGASGLEERRAGYARRLKSVRALLAAANSAEDPLCRSGTAEVRELRLRFKKKLVSMSNELRSSIAEARRNASSETNGVEASETTARLSRLERERKACNELRTQLAKGALPPFEPDEDVRNVRQRKLDEVVLDLKRLESETERLAKDTDTWIELATAMRGLKIVGHFDFDFASDAEPWVPSICEASGLYRFEAVSPGAYGLHLSAIGEIYYGENGIFKAHQAHGGADSWNAPLLKVALNPVFKPLSLSFPRQRFAPSSLAVALGIAGFELETAGEKCQSDNLPVVLPCDLSGLAGQMTDFCEALATRPELSLRPVAAAEKLESRLTHSENEGVSYLDYAPGSTDSEGPPPRAVAYMTGFSMPDPLPGSAPQPRARILANGKIYMPFVSRSAATTPGFVNLAVGYDSNGEIDRVASGNDSAMIIATPVHLMHAFGGFSFNTGYAPDPAGGDLYKPTTLVAASDSPHKTSASVQFNRARREFFADRPDRVKIIGGNGDMVLGSVAWSNSADRVKNAGGLGVPLDAGVRLRSDYIAQAADDAFLLNESRLQILRERNIVRDDLEALHSDAADHVEEAAAAAKKRLWSLQRAHQIFASCLENRVYGPVRAVTEDLVEAVIVLLLLNVPFAFSMERLIFGFTSIYKQILGFAGFFLATFAILYATHPAFALASAPVVIFLAFVIIMLGATTTVVMTGKIREEIRKLQGLASTVHGLQSESSTTLSAILIGIAGMRNRPLKTFLTCTTVVLLTFTILVFASFTSSLGVVETHLGRGADENRIELHRQSYLEIDAGFCDAVKKLEGGSFEVVRRGGLFRIPTRASDTGDSPSAPERVVYLPKSGETLELGAVAGFDEAEFRLCARFAGFCPGAALATDLEPNAGKTGNFQPLWLPFAATNALTALEEGDELRLNGVAMRFAGFFDSAAMQSLATLDGRKITPPDFQATLAAAGQGATSSLSAASLERMTSFEWFSPDRIAIARISDLKALWGSDCIVNFLALYPKTPDADIDAAALRLAKAFHGTVHAKSAAGARRLFFAKALSGSGFGDVALPLILGGLIIFSSLMGSIVAREKEIFTYSALGLAPVDVGALFFAESAVYSVIGGMGGYLLSQVVAKLLAFLGSKGILTPPAMNFSSLSSVCTILVVMAVVMLSTIIPAIRAGKSANPGVARRWKMPSPVGDNLKFVFPFTVSTADFSGILSFIGEHFENHADATLGAFAARDVKLFRETIDGRQTTGIEAKISLAPFDLGIFQKFRMYSKPFEVEGIDEVVVDLVRIGGSPVAWQRSNRDFASLLRQQFLLWRSLPVETVEQYRARTCEKIAKL